VLHEFAKKKFRPEAFLRGRVPSARPVAKVVIKKGAKPLGAGQIL
jgi:hypothetical protein